MELLQPCTKLSIFLYSLDQNQPPCWPPWFRGYVYHLSRWVSPLRRLSRVPKQMPQQSRPQLEYYWETHRVPAKMTQITQWSTSWQHISSRYWIIRRRTWDYHHSLAKVNTTVSLKSNFSTLQLPHNERDGVSNHQPDDCLLYRLFRRRSKKTSKLRVTGLCAGNSPGPVNSPHKGPVTRKMFQFDDVIMNEQQIDGLVQDFSNPSALAMVWEI